MGSPPSKDTFQRWWDRRYKQVAKGGQEWKMQPIASLERAIKTKTYVGGFIEILLVTAASGKRRVKTKPLTQEQLKIITNVFREEFNSVRWLGEGYGPAGTVWYTAASHLLAYLNAAADCGPIHRTCVLCGKLTMPTQGSPGTYCTTTGCYKKDYSTKGNKDQQKKMTLGQRFRRAKAERVKAEDALEKAQAKNPKDPFITDLRRDVAEAAKKEKAAKSEYDLQKQRMAAKRKRLLQPRV